MGRIPSVGLAQSRHGTHPAIKDAEAKLTDFGGGRQIRWLLSHMGANIIALTTDECCIATASYFGYSITKPDGVIAAGNDRGNIRIWGR